MKNYPKSLENLVLSFKLLPGIGDKSAKRMAYKILELEDYDVKNFAQSLINVKEKIRKCPICGNYTEEEFCNICIDKERNDNIICIVEHSKNLFVLEQAGVFNGVYHILEGLISPMNGINPDDLTINKLIERVNKNAVKELIFALTPSIESETTIMYITKILNRSDIKITKIAQGLPLGTDIDYIDDLTLEMAIKDRKTVC